MTTKALLGPVGRAEEFRAVFRRGEELFRQTAGAYRVEYDMSDPVIIRVFDNLGFCIAKEEQGT